MPTVDLSRHSVPLEEIYFDTFDGGSVRLSEAPPRTIERLRDVIPPLDQPPYDGPEGGAWLNERDLIVGFVDAEGQAYAYPLKILNFHEFLNDELAGEPVLISYCPLCLSGVVYRRRVGDRTISFGNTSALYQSNAVMFDRQTGSYWVQVSGEAVVGPLTGARLEPLPSQTLTWAEWLALHPQTRVLSRRTGYQRPYERDAFAGLPSALDAGRFPFPVSQRVRQDRRLRPSEVVLAVALGDAQRAYPVGRLGDAAVNDTLAGRPIVVFARAEGPAGGAYERQLDGRVLTFEWAPGFRDQQTGSVWDLAGRAVSGQLAGARLMALPTRTSFWFSIVATFPDVEIYSP